MAKGTLYVVATPIGNLQEMTPRAIEILKSVSVIACEDTRETSKLCTHFNINQPLISSHEHNEYFVVDKIIDMLEKGMHVALTSDAGYPGISDPGFLVINKCISRGIKIVVISGPSAFINALVGSGLNSDQFYFHGFLSSKTNQRKRELEKIAGFPFTLVFYEAPHRIVETLEEARKVLGNRQACIARELTKKFEEYIRGTLDELIVKTKENPLKGELVLVIEGTHYEEVATISNAEIVKKINNLIERGVSASEAIRQVAADNKLRKNEVYRIFMSEGRNLI
jgi:16S rRNA (cytidine1402-2'-O)-methyltransferase